MDHVKRKQIYETLIRSWSIETSSKLTIENPAKGQCGVTGSSRSRHIRRRD